MKRALAYWILASVGIACGGGDPPETGPEEARSAVPSPPTDPVVAIFLTEYTIDMPARLDAGEVRISVTNQGVEDHNLRILAVDSEEIVWETEGNVGANLTQEGTVDLPAGRYMVVCDFAGHDSRGMFMELEVRGGGN